MFRLINPPTVEDVKVLNISEVDLPDLFVCTDNQQRIENLNKYGYATRNVLMFGSVLSHFIHGHNAVTSWGGHLNITFDEMLDEIYSNKTREIPLVKGAELGPMKKVYNARYGYCQKISLYNVNKGVFVRTFHETEEVHIFLADKMKNTYPLPSFVSQSGELMYLTPGIEKWYEIKLTLISNENPNDQNACEHYDTENTYADCVDALINDIMIPELGCNPPYLSPKNKCTGIFYDSEAMRIRKFLTKLDFWQSYMMKLIAMDELPIQEQCKQPCLTTKIDVQLRNKGIPDHPKAATMAKANLKFQKTVEKRFLVVNYTLYNFVIDVGSSLGLWLGVSVLSLTDLWILLYNRFNTCNPDFKLF